MGIQLPDSIQKLKRFFVHANDWAVHIVGFMIHFQHVFHRRYEGRVLLGRDAPSFPGGELT
ncbi:hypothetical protein PUR_46740 [Paenibacillus sp. URB8-2]|nr:hypothetical protein PUR_46740 [Paenibacillus sp. URB8-2]